MDWNSIQQLVRILAQLGAGALVSNGVITEDLATGGIGAVVSLASIVWWIFWEKDRKAKETPTIS